MTGQLSAQKYDLQQNTQRANKKNDKQPTYSSNTTYNPYNLYTRLQLNDMTPQILYTIPNLKGWSETQIQLATWINNEQTKHTTSYPNKWPAPQTENQQPNPKHVTGNPNTLPATQIHYQQSKHMTIKPGTWPDTRTDGLSGKNWTNSLLCQP